MMSLLSSATDDQTTMKLPFLLWVTAASYLFGSTSWASEKSSPCGAPVVVKNRPLTLCVSLELGPSQTARKPPVVRPATAGTDWRQLGQELTRKGAPCGVGPAQAAEAIRQSAAKDPLVKPAAFAIEASFRQIRLTLVRTISLDRWGRAGVSLGELDVSKRRGRARRSRLMEDPRMNGSRPWLQDPRLYQILVLACLLAYGVVRLDFEIGAGRALLLLGTALLTQLACTRLWRLPAFDPKSALISGLSLCLLLRTGSAALAVLAAAVAIASKFALRVRGKHVFNPTNLGLVALMLATGRVWVSPGQWGSAAFLGFLVACLGGLVVNRAARSDVTYAFLAFYLAILFGRALWLGQPMAIPLHQLASGAFLIFTFFMISDPKTTPDTRAGRILFALLVALGAGSIHFVLYRPNGLILSLAFLSPLVPLLDRLLPGARYVWRGAPLLTAAPVQPLLEERRFA